MMKRRGRGLWRSPTWRRSAARACYSSRRQAFRNFARSGAFYGASGDTEEARICEFYAVGEHKVVFWKALRAA